MTTRLDSAFSKADDATAAVGMDYFNSAGCSMEQIFTPLEIRKTGSSSSPGFRTPINLGNDYGYFGWGLKNVGPTIHDLNPYFPKNIIYGDDGTAFFSNCDYNAVVMNPADDISLAKNSYRDQVTDVRTKGLRAPVILSGWGYDMCDTPVPYVVDGEYRAFDTNLINDRRYWKTGPLHVMWDEERQVWSGGPQIVVGTSDGDCSPGRLTGIPPKVYMSLSRAANTPNTLVSYGEKILVSNRDPSLQITRGQWIVAARLNYEWIPIQAGGGNSMYIGRFTGRWQKGSVGAVTVVLPAPEDNTPTTVYVENLFAEVGKAGTTSSCAFAFIGGYYYLLAAECLE